MVIFGAGASYDSSSEFHPAPEAKEPGSRLWAPPLTCDLFRDRHSQFGDIVKRYPRLSGILPFLRQPQGGRSIEEQLELYQNESSADSERIRQLLSVRYYVHDLFHLISENWLKETSGVTNYATLIDQIRHRNTTGEPVCLVTFNYDLLLDRATSTAQPALMTVQPPIPAFHCKALDKLSKTYYPSLCLSKLILAFQRSHHLNPYPSIFLPTPTL